MTLVLSMKTVFSREASANFYQTTRRHNPEDCNLRHLIPTRYPSQTRINRTTGENYASLSSMRRGEGEEKVGRLATDAT